MQADIELLELVHGQYVRVFHGHERPPMNARRGECKNATEGVSRDATRRWPLGGCTHPGVATVERHASDMRPARCRTMTPDCPSEPRTLATRKWAVSFLSRFRSRRSRVAALRSSILGDIAYAQAGRSEAFFSLARQYVDVADLARKGSPAQGTFIGMAAAALMRYLEAPAAQPFTHTHHAAALVQRVLAAQAKYGQPVWGRDPMAALHDLGAPWVQHVLDPSGVVATTAAI